MENQRLNAMTLSEQARREIYKYIKTMNLEKSNKLPREEALADIIGVSRITIRQALNDLAAEGMIFRRQGKGTFVNMDSLNIKVRFSPCMEFTQMIHNSGYTPSVKLLNIEKTAPEEEILRLLQMEDGEQLVMAEKLFMADDKVCAFCRDYFSLSLIGGEHNFSEFSNYEDSIFEYIYKLSGEKIEWDKVEIDTVLCDEIPGILRYEEMQEMRNMPLLYLKGINYSASDRPLIYANEYINTAFIKFNMIRQKNIRY